MSFAQSLNTGAFDAILNEIGSQAKFAVVLALTRTAKAVESAEVKGLQESLDNPTPFTERAFYVEPATKARPTAYIRMRPIQSRYLRWQIEGGQRAYKGFELKLKDQTFTAYLMPGAKIESDIYGNVPRSTIIAITRELNSTGSAKRYFVGVPKGQPDSPAGVYARVNNNTSIEPLLVFAQSAVYEKRFKWSEIAKYTINAAFETELFKAIEEVKRSAR